MRHRRLLPTAVLFTVALTAAACARPNHDETQSAWVSETDSALPLPPGATVEKAGSNPGKPVLVDGLLGSRRPGNESVEERVPEILRRGRLIVGVDQSQNLLSFRDATTGELEGFEVDLAREMSRDIFGDPSRVDFRFVDSSDRVLALEAGTVRLRIEDGALVARVEHAEDAKGIINPGHVLDKHLVIFAFRDGFAGLHWRIADAA